MRGKSLIKVVLVGLTALLLAVIPLVSACAEEAPTAPTAPTTPEEEVIEWKCIVTIPRHMEAYSLHVAFSDYIREASNGRLIITDYAADELCSAPEAYESVQAGVAEMIRDCPAYHVGTMPIGYFTFGWPQIVRNHDEIALLWDYFGMTDLVTRMHAENNMHYISWEADCGQCMVFTKPIRTIDDVKGLKVRATGALGKIFEELGATVVPVSAGEMYTSLATGVIDGAGFAGITGCTDFALQEVAKYYWTVSTAHHSTNTMVSMDAWNALPDDLKVIVELAVKATDSIPRDKYRYLDRTNQNMWEEEYGLKEIILSDEDQAIFLKACYAPMKDIAALDPWCAEAYEITKNFLEFMGRWYE